MSLSRRIFTTLVFFLALSTIQSTRVTLAAIVPSNAGSTFQLNDAANKIESSFPKNLLTSQASTQSLKYVERSVNIFKGAVVSTSASLMFRASAAYRSVNKFFESEFMSSPTNSVVKRAFLTGDKYDYFVSSTAPSASDFSTMPTMTYFPLHGNAIVVAYNLPATVGLGSILALDGPTICKIMRGNITQWDDPSIKATNPKMNFASAAGKGIVILMQNSGGSTQLALSSFCYKIDPMYAQLNIRPASNPAYPTGLYAGLKKYADSDRVNNGVSDEVWSFAITTWSVAQQIGSQIANYITPTGASIAPSFNSMSLTISELGTNGYPAGSYGFDLTNPSTPNAWPFVSMSYLHIEKAATLSTCATKKLLIEYFLWFYTSTVVQKISISLGLAVLDSLYIDQIGLLESMRSSLKCQNSQLVNANSANGYIASSALSFDLLELFTNFYLDLDSTLTYTSSVLTTSLSVNRVAAGELSFALVPPTSLTANDQTILKSNNVDLVPAFFVGIVPIFNLPTEIDTLAADTDTVKQLGLPTLLPLTLDLDTMTGVFIGAITNWLDPRLLALNPQLEPWFQATNSSTNITIVVGATATSDPNASARLLFSVMRHSTLAAKDENAFALRLAPTATTKAYNSYFTTRPFTAVATKAPQSSNIIMVDVESRLSIKATTVSGSISYRALGAGAGNGEFDPATEFQLQIKNSGGLTETVQPNSDALRSCSQAYTVLNDEAVVDSSSLTTDEILSGVDAELLNEKISYMRNWTNQANWIDIVNPAPGCWPLSTLLSWVIPLSYTSASTSASNVASSCDIGRHSIEFINYVQSTKLLDGPTETFGMVRLASFPGIERLSQQVIYSATCDDEPLLIIRPVIYSISSGVESFGIAMTVIICIMAAVSIVLIFTYRSHFVIRSSSVPFMIMILIGIACLAISSVLWSSTPSRSTCMGFQWMACLGYMSLFVPLFAKTWRVWRIFSGSQLKVVKISNMKLLMYSSIAIGIDCIILIGWSSTSPMKPIEYSNMVNGVMHYYTHCSVDMSSSSGASFIVIEGIYKAGLLLFGAVMAVSTRNVKGTFNESVQIAWSVYSALLSSIIVVAMIAFVGAVQDTLIILVQIFIYWLCFTCWGLLFAPKFQLLFSDEQSIIDASKSELPQEKSNGFSFASVAAMTTIQLKQYYYALKIQIAKCETTLKITPLAKFADVKNSSFPALPSKKSGSNIGHSMIDDVEAPSRDTVPICNDDNVREKYILNSRSSTPTLPFSHHQKPQILNWVNQSSAMKDYHAGMTSSPRSMTTVNSAQRNHSEDYIPSTPSMAIRLSPPVRSPSLNGKNVRPTPVPINLNQISSNANNVQASAVVNLSSSVSPTNTSTASPSMARSRLSAQSNGLPLAIVDETTNDSTIVISPLANDQTNPAQSIGVKESSISRSSSVTPERISPPSQSRSANSNAQP